MSSIPSINDPTGIGHVFYDWATSNKWAPAGEYNHESEVLALAMYFPRDGPISGSDGEGLLGTPFDTAVLDPDPDTNTLHVTSATGLFQVYSVYQKDKGQLNPVSVYLSVPGYGPALLLKEQSVKLMTQDEAPVFRVIITDKDARYPIEARFTFYFVDAGNQREVLLNCYLSWAFGEGRHTSSLFPASISSPYGATLPQNEAQKYQALMKTDEEVLQLSSIQEHNVSNFNEDDINNHTLLLRFLDTQSLFSSGIGNVVAITSDHDPNASKKPYTFSLHFSTVCEFSGLIDPSTLAVSADLYIKVPIAGRVKFGTYQGSLIKGVQVAANVYAAKGTVKVYVEANDNNKHDLYIGGSLKVIFYGTLDFSGVLVPDSHDPKLFPLPF